MMEMSEIGDESVHPWNPLWKHQKNSLYLWVWRSPYGENAAHDNRL